MQKRKKTLLAADYTQLSSKKARKINTRAYFFPFRPLSFFSQNFLSCPFGTISRHCKPSTSEQSNFSLFGTIPPPNGENVAYATKGARSAPHSQHNLTFKPSLIRGRCRLCRRMRAKNLISPRVLFFRHPEPCLFTRLLFRHSEFAPLPGFREIQARSAPHSQHNLTFKPSLIRGRCRLCRRMRAKSLISPSVLFFPSSRAAPPDRPTRDPGAFRAALATQSK